MAKKKMTSEEAFEGDKRDLQGMMHALFSMLLPIGLVTTFIASFVYAYQRNGALGILLNGVLMVTLAIAGEEYTRKENVDSNNPTS